MKKFKIIFYSVFFLYFICSLYFAFSTEAMYDRFGMLKFLDFLQYWAIFGLLLYLAEWVVENLHISQLRNKNAALEKEVARIKSRLFDIEEESGNTDQSLKAFGASLPKKEDRPNDVNE